MQVSWIDPERLRQLVEQIDPEQEHFCEVDRERAAKSQLDTTAGSGRANAWLEPASTFPEQFVLFPKLAEMPPDTHPEEDSRAPEPVAVAHAMPLSRIRDKLRAIRQRASDAGILTRGSDPVQTEAAPPLPTASADHSLSGTDRPPRPVDDRQSQFELAGEEPHRSFPPFEIPQGSRDQRLAAFACWARQLLDDDDSHVLVMNGEGEVLWGGSAKSGLVLSAMMAWGSAMHANTLPPSGVPGVMCAPLSSGRVLTVVPCDTVGGVFHAAVVAPKAVPQAAVSLLKAALAAAIS